MNPNILIVTDDITEFSEFSVLLVKYNYNFEFASCEHTRLMQKLNEKSYHLIVTILQKENVLKLCQLTEIFDNYDYPAILVLCKDPEIDKTIHANACCHPFETVTIPFDEEMIRDKIEQMCTAKILENKIKLIKSRMEALEDTDRTATFPQTIDFPASKKIRQVNIGLFHGAGLGGIMTTLSMILSKKKLNEATGKYEISPKAISLFEENYKVARDLINGLTRAQAILMDAAKITEKTAVAGLPEIFTIINEKLQPMLMLKNQQILIGPLPEDIADKYIIFDCEFMDSVINELLINAMKYSPENEIIYVLFLNSEKGLKILFINKAVENEDHTIGVEPFYEKMVFESFFRINNVCHEGYGQEEYQAGIGLAVVKWIMEKHYGDITIRNVDNAENNKDVVVSLLMKYTG